MDIHLSYFLVLLLIIPSLVAQTHGKKQVDALDKLRKAKRTGNFGVDTSLFMSISHENVKLLGVQDGMKDKDKILRLPGQPRVGFSQFGGYVTVDESAGRAMYYYFAEAHENKESLPLLLWLNGGPGCSSLGYGAMEELGPFRVYSDGKTLYSNKYSWNYAANVLFLESPAGVGFSYSNTTSDYLNSGDRKTALDNYVFLLNWLERFPEYKGREFYIAGESYSGHYVPQLAHTILLHNNTAINFKGILIGNAAINLVTDDFGMFDYWENHGLASEESISNYKKYCSFLDDRPDPRPKECKAARKQIAKDFYFVNIYNIYAPSCFHQGTTLKPNKASLKDFDPCTDNYVYAYLNRADVQEAMHANVTKLTLDWQACNDVVNSKWNDTSSTVLPLLQELMEKGLRVWVYSGDTDARVPFTSTRYSLKKMKLPVKTVWHPWYIGGEVGGYTEVYEGLTFATVRGAGHEVPSYQPQRALSLIMHFLAGTPLPDTTRYVS